MKKQLIVICDMEGVSGIFEKNKQLLKNGTEEWYKYGRRLMTYDVLAVCDAANEFGIDEILIYDGHYAGNEEFNIILEKLPENSRVFDLENRCFDWRRIRGQANLNPFGVITVGQHARNGEKDAYFPHTIQSPPIKEVLLNGIHIAEIAQGVLSFNDTKYLANIGCAASMREALELSDSVVTIPVKDKSKDWEPSAHETYPIIKSKVLEALENVDNSKCIDIKAPYKFSMTLTDEYVYSVPDNVSWKGHFEDKVAYWEAPSIEIGLEIFNYVRNCLKKSQE